MADGIELAGEATDLSAVPVAAELVRFRSEPVVFEDVPLTEPVPIAAPAFAAAGVLPDMAPVVFMPGLLIEPGLFIEDEVLWHPLATRSPVQELDVDDEAVDCTPETGVLVCAGYELVCESLCAIRRPEQSGTAR